MTPDAKIAALEADLRAERTSVEERVLKVTTPYAEHIAELESDLRAAQEREAALRVVLGRALGVRSTHGASGQFIYDDHGKYIGTVGKLLPEWWAALSIPAPDPASSEFQRGMERAAEMLKARADDLGAGTKEERWIVDELDRMADAIRAEAAKLEAPIAPCPNCLGTGASVMSSENGEEWMCLCNCPAGASRRSAEAGKLGVKP